MKELGQKIANANAFVVFVILFVPYFLLAAFGIGFKFGSFIVGAFPSMYIYFGWLLILLKTFQSRLTPQHITNVGLVFHVRLIYTNFILVLPLYWGIVNLMYSRQASPILAFPVGSFFIYSIITCWICLSKTLYILEKHGRTETTFAKYRRIFFYFMFGPLTIWLLQRKIREVNNLRIKSKPSVRYS